MFARQALENVRWYQSKADGVEVLRFEPKLESLSCSTYRNILSYHSIATVPL